MLRSTRVPYAQGMPGQRTERQTCYDPPIDSVQAATGATNPDDLDWDDGASDASDVFDYDDPAEQTLDDSEWRMHQFADDTAARFGGEMVRGVRAAKFFERRQDVQTRPLLERRQAQVMDHLYDMQQAQSVLPAAEDYLQRVAAPVRTRRMDGGDCWWRSWYIVAAMRE